MDKIAIIIVHYNTDEETKACLESLNEIKHENFDYRVILVDNASKDNFVLPKKIKNTELIRSDTNLGFTGGNNLGFRYANQHYNPDYFLLLNSDTLVAADFLEKLYQCLQENPKLGLVSPKIYFAAGDEFHRESYSKNNLGKVIWFAGGVIDWDNLQTFHLGVDEVDRGQFETISTFDYASGCCLLVRREALAASGIFDDDYFLYYEDTDLSLRLRANNWQLGFCPSAVIWHKNGGSTQGSGSPLQNFYLTRNRLLFFSRYGRGLTKLRAYRLARRLYFHGDQVEKKAARNFFLKRFGKEVVV
ncbi:MAG: glycosyltransferase family 2 protein [bacterium]|nr:glycosyltransferase family 2 protein [bacterium]